MEKKNDSLWPYEKTFRDAENNDFFKKIYLYILERENGLSREEPKGKERESQVDSELNSGLIGCFDSMTPSYYSVETKNRRLNWLHQPDTPETNNF